MTMRIKPGKFALLAVVALVTIDADAAVHRFMSGFIIHHDSS